MVSFMEDSSAWRGSERMQCAGPTICSGITRGGYTHSEDEKAHNNWQKQKKMDLEVCVEYQSSFGR